MSETTTERCSSSLSPPKIRLQVGLVRKGDPETHCTDSHLDADEQILKVCRLNTAAHQSDEGEEENHHALRGTEDRWREESEWGTQAHAPAYPFTCQYVSTTTDLMTMNLGIGLKGFSRSLHAR